MLAAAAATGPGARSHAAETERRALADALDAAQGNKSRAAEQLGVSRKTLYARMRRLGMEVDERV